MTRNNMKNEQLYNQFKKEHPETIGETDREFDTQNYLEWLENKLLSLLSKEKELSQKWKANNYHNSKD